VTLSGSLNAFRPEPRCGSEVERSLETTALAAPPTDVHVWAARRRGTLDDVRRVCTIGVYEWDLKAFLDALRDAEVRVLLDLRQRRGVRGPQYAWANSQRLQRALSQAGIGYRHHPELAPTTELRQLQYAEDARQGVGKRSRIELAPAYRQGYTRQIVDRADLDLLVADLPERGTASLFCVEADPEACHRSIVAERLHARYGIDVVHLRPDR
jgi:uncharacterized protein (DUF488 family)